MQRNKCYGCLRETVTCELKDYLDNVVGYWCHMCIPRHIRGVIERNQNNTHKRFWLVLNRENKIEIYRGDELIGVEPIKEGGAECSTSHLTQDLQQESPGIDQKPPSESRNSEDLMSSPLVGTVTIRGVTSLIPAVSTIQTHLAPTDKAMYIGSSPPPDGTDLTRQTITGRLSPSVNNAVIPQNWGNIDRIMNQIFLGGDDPSNTTIPHMIVVDPDQGGIRTDVEMRPALWITDHINDGMITRQNGMLIHMSMEKYNLLMSFM